MDEKNNEIILFENQGVKLEVNLKDHPHIHCIVPAGGLDSLGNTTFWIIGK